MSMRLLIASLLILPVLAQAQTLTGTSTIDVSSDNRTDPSVSHTVPSGTTLLIVSVGTRQDQTLNGITWNTSESLTAIRDTDSTADSNNMKVATYGLVNPTAGSFNVDIDYAATINMDWAVISNWTGTDSSSVANATNYHNEDENNTGSASNTTVLTSAGTSGNVIYVAAAIAGADGDPGSESPTFTEIANQDTGGGAGSSSDASLFVGYVDAPSANTITWAVTDENAGHLLELVAGNAALLLRRRR